MNNPKQNVTQLGLQPGMDVADIGAGSGYYAVAAGELVGNDGRVLAVDVQKDILDSVQQLAKENHLMNVKAVWGNAEKEGGTRLRNNSVDAVIVANTLFQIDDQAALAREVARICKAGAQLFVVEWSDSHGGLGPAPDHIVPAERAKEVFTLAGFEPDRDIDVGDHQYGFVMVRSDE